MKRRGSPQRLDELPLGLRPDARHLAQAPLLGRFAELVQRRDPERPADLDAALGAHTEQPPEPDQVRRQLALQVGELLDVAGLDELAQAAFDPGADPAQLLRAAGPDELGDGRRRRADHLGRPAVGADRVVLRVGEFEQRGE